MEARLFPEGTVPEWTTPTWYEGRETAPHLEQAGHQQRLYLAADMIRSVTQTGPVLDLGAGDGGLLALLASHDIPGIGFDLQQTNVDHARNVRNVDVRWGDVVSPAISDHGLLPPGFERPQVAVACEMLEHLIDPHALVRQVRDLGVPYLVASSPYTETAEAHYGFHTWAWDLAGYRLMLESNGWRVLRQECAWICQVALAVRA